MHDQIAEACDALVAADRARDHLEVAGGRHADVRDIDRLRVGAGRHAGHADRLEPRRRRRERPRLQRPSDPHASMRRRDHAATWIDDEKRHPDDTG